MAKLLRDGTFFRIKDKYIEALIEDAIDADFLNEAEDHALYFGNWYYLYHWNGAVVWANYKTHQQLYQEQLLGSFLTEALASDDQPGLVL
ncbi:hypothetical protein [Kiloniella sp.]|uniref:hypothetical protein n=1 Tax=Kiloniella sp. TaxID=1938587 RepID=UPI003B028E0E